VNLPNIATGNHLEYTILLKKETQKIMVRQTWLVKLDNNWVGYQKEKGARPSTPPKKGRQKGQAGLI